VLKVRHVVHNKIHYWPRPPGQQLTVNRLMILLISQANSSLTSNIWPTNLSQAYSSTTVDGHPQVSPV